MKTNRNFQFLILVFCLAALVFVAGGSFSCSKGDKQSAEKNSFEVMELIDSLNSKHTKDIKTRITYIARLDSLTENLSKSAEKSAM